MEQRTFEILKVEERAEKITDASGETMELSGTPEDDEGDRRGSKKNKKEARKNKHIDKERRLCSLSRVEMRACTRLAGEKRTESLWNVVRSEG